MAIFPLSQGRFSIPTVFPGGVTQPVSELYRSCASAALALLPNNTQASGTPCNIIPTALIDQNMVTYAKTIFPAPNLMGNPNFNGIDTTSTVTRQDTGSLRIDHQFTEKRQLLGPLRWFLAACQRLRRISRAAAQPENQRF